MTDAKQIHEISETPIKNVRLRFCRFITKPGLAIWIVVKVLFLISILQHGTECEYSGLRMSSGDNRIKDQVAASVNFANCPSGD